MKKQTCKALAYCFDMLSFVFQEKEAGDRITAIYLFGSAARGDLGAESDIDLFVESSVRDEEIAQKMMEAGISKFMVSNDYRKWKLFHFQHPFSVQVGQIAEWDLRQSIASEGVLVYSKRATISPQSRMVLFVIALPRIKKEYVKIRRALFGRDEDIYRKSGTVLEMNGKKISSNVFLIPKEEQGRMMALLAKEKIEFSMTEIAMMES